MNQIDWFFLKETTHIYKEIDFSFTDWSEILQDK